MDQKWWKWFKKILPCISPIVPNFSSVHWSVFAWSKTRWDPASTRSETLSLPLYSPPAARVCCQAHNVPEGAQGTASLRSVVQLWPRLVSPERECMHAVKTWYSTVLANRYKHLFSVYFHSCMQYLTVWTPCIDMICNKGCLLFN